MWFNPKKLIIVDINENKLAEAIRDIRSTPYLNLPEIITYPIDFGSNVFEKLFDYHKPFDIVANFAAHKHVRSEKDIFSIEAMFQTNFIKAERLLQLLAKNPPKHFFCVSTDKATKPVNIMGATKKLMEDVVFAYQDIFKVTTARFANVAFSNGSLLESFINRFENGQPLVCPNDIRRYFVSPIEAGQLCLLANICGNSGEIFIPKLNPEKDLVPIKNALLFFLEEQGLFPKEFASEEQVKRAAAERMSSDSTYPIFLPTSDTTGEKPIEEFYAVNDILDENRFNALNVIETFKGEKKSVENLLDEAQKTFEKEITKKDLVIFLEKYVDGFKHEEKGKHLDQKL